MRLRAKVDTTQRAITLALRAAGVSVQPIHQLGKGVPDLLCGLLCMDGQKVNILLEIKDGSKSPSHRKLTKDELKWHAEWRGNAYVVSGVDEAVQLLQDIRSGKVF